MQGTKSLLWLLTLSSILQLGNMHLVLVQPASRNAIFNSDWCPHCLNAGGPAAVSNNGQLRWPAGNRGICGDPAAQFPRKHEVGGPFANGTIAATYQEGSIIDVSLELYTSHKGRMMYRICRIAPADPASESQQLTEECFDRNPLVSSGCILLLINI